MLSRGDIHDDVLAAHVVTVPEVRLSPDLKLATVYIISLGGTDTEQVIDALNRHRKYIRGVIAHALNLRFSPELRFRRDETFDEASRIDALLSNTQVRYDVDKD